MSGHVITRCGGPVLWKAKRQERTSRSSCEAEIYATDECAKDTLSIRHRAEDLGFSDTQQPTTLFNDNQGCVDWCKSTTSKGTKHIALRENAVRESVQHFHELTVHHISGKINSSDIFTKELRDAIHFRKLRNSFMVPREVFGVPLSAFDASLHGAAQA